MINLLVSPQLPQSVLWLIMIWFSKWVMPKSPWVSDSSNALYQLGCFGSSTMLGNIQWTYDLTMLNDPPGGSRCSSPIGPHRDAQRLRAVQDPRAGGTGSNQAQWQGQKGGSARIGAESPEQWWFNMILTGSFPDLDSPVGGSNCWAMVVK